jgi:predicted amidophosphoribosyltransferase
VAPGVTRCGACLAAPPPLERCLVAAAYQWPWSGLIARLKFQQDVGLAGPLAALLRQAPGVAEALAQADWVLPMPLARERLAERGHNPALLLARALAPERCRSAWLLRVRDTRRSAA